MLELHPKTVKRLRIEQDYKSWKLQLKHLQGNKWMCSVHFGKFGWATLF